MMVMMMTQQQNPMAATAAQQRQAASASAPAARCGDAAAVAKLGLLTAVLKMMHVAAENLCVRNTEHCISIRMMHTYVGKLVT
jgi:hypothetical protein